MYTVRGSFTKRQLVQKPSYFKAKLVESESVNCMKKKDFFICMTKVLKSLFETRQPKHSALLATTILSPQENEQPKGKNFFCLP